MSGSATPEAPKSQQEQDLRDLRFHLQQDLLLWSARDRFRLIKLLGLLLRSMTLEQLEAAADELDATFGVGGPSAGATRR
jgi:hypothetical protein